MGNNFNLGVDELYSIIIQPIDEVYKLTAVRKYKKSMEIFEDSSFSDKYCSEVQHEKEKGIVYTPFEIADYMVRNLIRPNDIIGNPYLKIMDPACGSGNIIVPCFLYLREIYEENLEAINKANGLSLRRQELARHIIDNNIFGCDLDNQALKVLQIDLFIASRYINPGNFYNEDFLTSETNEEFNIFLGNPPYVGHKTVDKDYSRLLKESYKGIYKDKGDISYCFFSRSLSLLENSRSVKKLGFITSRYFIESPSGIELRKLLNRGFLDKILDFYGIRPFKNIGIDPVIIFMDFNRTDENIEVIKPFLSGARHRKDFLEAIFLNQGKGYRNFFIKSAELRETGWILKDQAELGIIKKIEEKCGKTLSEISSSSQGIITGCDKAFVLDSETCQKENIEIELLKPWIKSSSIEKFNVKNTDMYLIYSDLIEDEKDYPNAISYISRCRDKLLQRRECKTGARKWYMLQWGRKPDLFEGNSIIFPYKSSSNRFAKAAGIYYSADVYSLSLNEGAALDKDKLLRLLNSRTYEFYFKSFAKKLGEDQYEYYPNTVMRLRVPAGSPDEFNSEEEIFDYFGFNQEEISIMKKDIQ